MSRRARVWTTAGLAIIVLVIGALAALPVGVRWLAESRLSDMTGRDASIADVDINVFTRRLAIHDLVLAGARADEPPLVELDRATARFALWDLLRGRVHLYDVHVRQPVVRLIRFSSSETNVGPVVERMASRGTGEPLVYDLERLLVENGRVVFDDRAAPEPVVWEATDLTAELRHIATVVDSERGAAEARFELAGAPVTIAMDQIAMRPLHAQLSMEIAGLDLGRAWAYMPPEAAVNVSGGSVTIAAEATYDAERGARASARATATEVVVRQDGWTGRRMEMGPIELAAEDVVYQGGALTAAHVTLAADPVLVDARGSEPRRYDLTRLRIAVSDARYPRGEPADFSIAAGLPSGGRVDAVGQMVLSPFAVAAKATLQEIDLTLLRPYLTENPTVTVTGTVPDATVVVAWSEALRASAEIVGHELVAERTGQAKPIVVVPELRASIQRLSWDDGRVEIDRLVATGAAKFPPPGAAAAPDMVELDPVRLVIEDAQWPSAKDAAHDAPVRASATLGSGGRVEATGTLQLDPIAATLDISAADVDVAFVEPYIPASSSLSLRTGQVDADLAVELAPGPIVRVSGHLSTQSVAVHRLGQDQPFILHPQAQAEVTGLEWANDTLTVERVTIDGAPTLVDANAEPTQRYDFTGLHLRAEHIAWPARRPTEVRVAATTSDGGASTIEGTIDLSTFAAAARVDAAGLDLSRLNAYLPDTAAVQIRHGRGAVDAVVRHDRRSALNASGTATINDVVLAGPDGAGPILRAPEILVEVADLVAHNGTVAADRLTVTGTPVVVGAGAEPGRAAELARVRVEADKPSWPVDDTIPLSVRVETTPDGRLVAHGSLAAGARAIEGSLTFTDVALEAVQPFLPVSGELHGTVDGQAQVSVALAPTVRVTASGDLTGESVSLGAQPAPPVTVKRVELRGIDLAWPSALAIDRVALVEPSALIERTEDGTLPLRAMLSPPGARAADAQSSVEEPQSTAVQPAPDVEPASNAAQPASYAPEPDEHEPMPVRIGEIALEQGDVRFVDRTTTPDYSEVVSNLFVRVTDLQSGTESRADLAIEGLVGIDGALALRGEMAPFAEPFYLEVRGELTDFAVPRTNPYLRKFLDWYARRGTLSTELHYRIVGHEIEGTNELVIERLNVAREREPSAEQTKIGVPLGLAVSLLKGPGGDIRLSVPVSGNLRSPDFSFGDAFATALKNVFARAVTAPFRAIGKVLRSNEGETVEALEVDPVAFEPGSAELTPAAKKHVQRVADFLRASPYVGLDLVPVVTEDDILQLRSRAVAAEVQRIQRETSTDFGAAAATLFQRRFPERGLPDSTEAMLAALRDAEPMPVAQANELARDRSDATRQALVEAAGVEPHRLHPGSVMLRGAGASRVEFELRAS